MNPTHTPPRSVRVPEDVWQAAKAEAATELGPRRLVVMLDGTENVSEAVVKFLRAFGRLGR